MSRPQLHVLTDARRPAGQSHRDIAEAAFRGGADVVQLRDKTLAPEQLVPLARELGEVARAAGRLLIVNDFLEVALAARADGLHLGPDDLPIDEARGRWPRPALLGSSARSVERARRLELAGADYLGCGPVYGTRTKPDAPGAIGLAALTELAAAVGIPVIGIGGIAPGNAAAVVRAGAAGIAVVSSVVGAPNPEGVVRRLRAEIDRA